MIELWHKIRHPRRSGLIKKLAATPPPQTPAPSLPTPTQQKLDAYLDKAESQRPEQALKENHRILTRTRGLSDPQKREHVAAWVRTAVLQRSPDDFKAVESMIFTSNVYGLCKYILSLSFVGPSFTAENKAQLDALLTAPDRVLENTVFWCQALSVEQAEEMHTYFSSTEGQRWMAAVEAALTTAISTAGGPETRRASRQLSDLERLLMPYLTTAHLRPEVVEAAAHQLTAMDVSLAQIFFGSSECQGMRWMKLLGDTLQNVRDMYQAPRLGARARGRTY